MPRDAKDSSALLNNRKPLTTTEQLERSNASKAGQAAAETASRIFREELTSRLRGSASGTVESNSTRREAK